MTLWRRLGRMLWSGRCNQAASRLDAALAEAEQVDQHVKRVALDLINESVEPPAEPYTPDRILEAVEAVTTRYRQAHRRDR